MRIVCNPRRCAVYCRLGCKLLLGKSWSIHPLRLFELCCIDSSVPSTAGLCFVGTYFLSTTVPVCRISCSRLAVNVFCRLLMLYIHCSTTVLSVQCVIFEIPKVVFLMTVLCSRHALTSDCSPSFIMDCAFSGATLVSPMKNFVR